MKALSAYFSFDELPALLRGDTVSTCAGTERMDRHRIGCWLTILIVGSALYGAAIGAWRVPLQAFYTAVKLPLVILLTTLGNALLNGMLAPLLGVNLGFRESLRAVLLSFTVASVLLGGFAPLLLFVVWNTPQLHTSLAEALPAYRFMQLLVVAGIACAGVVGNVRLLPLIRLRAANERAALRVLFAWLAGNLFLGSQICWVLRPFIGRPLDSVTFFSAYPWEGNFFETIFQAFRMVFFQ